MGPTASGKTALAADLCRCLPADIISVDSALVYRGMNIGTAKPSSEELALAPHKLIDIRDPAEPYSAKDFCEDAAKEIQSIFAGERIPLLVGGTMLYFKSLLEGISDMPASETNVRQAIVNTALEKGWPYIHKLLAEVDPESAARIHPNHSQRLTRALEVYRLSGIPLSEWQNKSVAGLLGDYNWVQLAIAPRDRKVLHQRIEQRFKLMLDRGLVEEVKLLYERDDLNPDLPAIRAVGYRQVWDYLAGEVDYDTMVERGIAATRQLAKRQLTWLRSWHGLSWVYTQDERGELLRSDEILRKALNIITPMTI